MEEWEGHARQKPEPGQRLKGGSSLGLSLGLQPLLGPSPSAAPRVLIPGCFLDPTPGAWCSESLSAALT